MKLVTLAALLCAMLALTRAAGFAEIESGPEREELIQEALPEAEAEPETETEETNEDGFTEEDFEPEKEETIEEEAQPELETEETNQEKDNGVAKASWCRCPRGWTYYNRRCFLYVSSYLTWHMAERRCRCLGGNLASVYNNNDYRVIQNIVARANCYRPATWIGGHRVGCSWRWSNGVRVSFTRWCYRFPSRYARNRCVMMNYSARKCWVNTNCNMRRPFVCARKAW